jgi:hypothetical protein
LISWATTNCANAQVTVQSAGGEENLFGDAPSFQNSQAPWIGLTTFTFRLYGDRTRTLLLDSVTVIGVPAPTGSISASPRTFTLATSAGTFSTTLSWTTSGETGGWVTLAAGEDEEQLIGQGGSNAGMEVSGLGAGQTVFRLYGDEALTQLLDSIETSGAASPLTVQSDGTLRLDNRPFTGVGVNYYSAFERVLDNSSNTTYDAGFEALSRWGVPFARLDVSGYWPSKTRMFFTNRTEYLRRLDGVVASAERHGVGLIPSLFWTTFTFPDLAGEHLDQLAVSSSVTRQKMREFATEIVNRYKDSRAIWAWEFGNEWTLAVDLPNGAEFLPPTYTHLGNPATRDPVRDVLATDIILPAMLEFANLVNELDPGRPISTGHATPRSSQWHQDQWKRGLLDINSSWSTDSSEQAREIALRHCPDPFNLLSIHVYGSDPERLPLFASAASGAGKALFAGEFGTPAGQDAQYVSMLAAVRDYSPLAAVWVFDRPKPVNEYNITITNSRSWMLRSLLPATFERWSRGYGASETPDDAQTIFGQYVFGAALPGGAVPLSNGGVSGEFLELTAVVRTNDPSVAVYGQTADSLLLPESWSSAGVQQADFSDQTNVLPGCVRRTFRVPVSNGTGKFLCIRAEEQ